MVVGSSGTGKTKWAISAIGGLDRVVAFDPEEEFCQLPGFVQVRSLDKLKALLALAWDGAFRIAYIPRDLHEEADLHGVSLLVEALGEAYRTGRTEKMVMLVVDELNLSFPNPPKPKYSGFARICSKGRKRGINVIGVSQRPAEVATRFRGNLDGVRCFALSLPNDWDAVREIMGPDAEAAARKLPRFGHIFWTQEEWKEVQPLKLKGS